MKELSGPIDHATNNRAELKAILEGLRALRRPCAVSVRSDSKIALAGCRRAVARRLERRPKPLANLDLLAQIADAAAEHEVQLEWVKGHAGDPDNRRADALARAAARKVLQASIERRAA